MLKFRIKMDKLIELLKSIKTHLIYATIIIVLLFALSISVKSCQENKQLYNNNVTALIDSVSYYKAKNGELVASKSLLEGDMSLLEKTNSELANELNSMKIKNPEQVVKIVTEYIKAPSDTVWAIDSTNANITKQFNFTDDYRSLTGDVYLKNNMLGLNISKDEVYANYTLAIKDNKAYITTNNPYIKISDIQGITIPTPKIKHFYLGPSINFGYDPIQNKPTFNVGVSIGYGLFSW